MSELIRLYYGVITRILDLFINAKPKSWVFGAAGGGSYSEGSKYMLEYMLKNHNDFECTFITKNKKLYQELKDKGLPCEYNYSIKGCIRIARAGKFFTTHSNSDIFYDFRKKGRKNYYLVHGQPLKIAQLALRKNATYWENVEHKNSFVSALRAIVHRCLISDMQMKDFDFVSATSYFLKPYMEIDFDHMIPVKVLGMPRNDGLFDHERMQKEKWIEGLDGKFVITYMPTHRLYGHGEVSPTPFINRPDVQSWFKENNIVFLMKQHPNMIPKLKDNRETETIKDITKLGLDPQVVIYHSDVLITDFSSVWMDYLLLRRPNIFYIYDDFEHNDAGCHYDIREDPPGHFCRNEDELYALIKQCRRDYVSMIPSDRIINKYHKFVDGNSCQRYFEEITNER